MTEPTMSPWRVITDPLTIRRTGKLLEELGELTSVVARIQIQGADEIDPASEKPNRQRLQEEIADVYAQLDLAMTHFNLDRQTVARRAARKMDQMAEWEQVLKDANAQQQEAP